eukprot:373538-Pelagomonas_calceolata.AAC.2
MLWTSMYVGFFWCAEMFGNNHERMCWLALNDFAFVFCPRGTGRCASSLTAVCMSLIGGEGPWGCNFWTCTATTSRVVSRAVKVLMLLAQSAVLLQRTVNMLGA